MAYFWTAKILNEYVIGSHVYGTNNENSDVDYLIVVDGEPEVDQECMYDSDLQYISKRHFQRLLENNHMQALECVFSPSNFIIKESFKPTVQINKTNLRNTTSAICSNSWVKGKKKIIQDDIYIGLKSYFHSIRIMEFANQILQTNSIYFNSVNWIWNDLKKLENQGPTKILATIDSNFKPIRKSIHAHFKELTNENRKLFKE